MNYALRIMHYELCIKICAFAKIVVFFETVRIFAIKLVIFHFFASKDADKRILLLSLHRQNKRIFK